MSNPEIPRHPVGYNRFQIGCVIVELMVSYINLTNDLLNEREFWINVYLD